MYYFAMRNKSAIVVRCWKDGAALCTFLSSVVTFWRPNIVQIVNACKLILALPSLPSEILLRVANFFICKVM